MDLAPKVFAVTEKVAKPYQHPELLFNGEVAYWSGIRIAHNAPLAVSTSMVGLPVMHDLFDLEKDPAVMAIRNSMLPWAKTRKDWLRRAADAA